MIGVNILMLTKEECEKACLYLLEHCYETNAPTLENGNVNKTYTFTPAGFEESKIFKGLIEEHFTPKALTFEDLINIWCKNKRLIIYDKNNKVPLEVMFVIPQRETFRCFVGGAEDLIEFRFEKNRFYPITIPKVMEE